MPDLPVPPDDDLLRRYLQGRLPPDELEAVGRYLDAHPGAASSLNALAADDTLVTALRSAAAVTGSVSPELAAVMTRVTLLGEAAPATPADGAMPTATAAPAAPFDPAYAPTVDPDGEADPDPVADLLGRLAASDRPGDLGRLGGFRVVRVLGRGGMGAVFEADDPQLGRRLALKVMLPYLAARPRAKQRFLREAAAAARVEHDHIVPVYLIGEDAGVPFLAMPLLAGESLDDAMKDRRPLPVEMVLRVGREAAEGLAAAHAAGLVHRDVKPANVWLERDAGGAFRRVRLLDFGLAKAVSDATAGADDLTLPGAVMGTPAYMAPEQARGLPVDARADLFSLGCVLYQMATGRRPFAGPDPLAVLSALANDTPPPAHTVNPAVPPALSALIGRLLVKDPAGRPASARAVADELARIIADPDPAVPADPPAAAPAPRRRWPAERWVAVAAGLLLAVIAAVGAYHGKTVVRVLSDEGELVVEVDDPAVEVTVKQGEAVVRDTTKDRAFVLKAGSGEVVFRDPDTGAAALTRAFTIERGGKVVLRATAAELAPRPKPPEPPAIPDSVALGPVAGRPVLLNAPPDQPPAMSRPGRAGPRAGLWNSAGRPDGPADRPLARADKNDGWLAVSPDGKWLAVPRAGDAPDVLVLDAATGAARRAVPTGSRHRAMRAAFTPDGRRLVTADTDANEAAVWDLATGRRDHTLPLGTGAVSVAVRPDGRQVAVGGRGRVRLFDPATGRAVRDLAHGASHHHGLAYSPDGARLATAAQDEGSVKLWDPDTGAEVKTFGGLPANAVGVAFSPDGARLAAGGETWLRVWEVGTGDEVLARDGVPAPWVGFGPAGRLWTGPWRVPGEPGDARPARWDVAAGTAEPLAVPPLGGFASFALSPDGSTLYAADNGGAVWACDPQTGRPKGGPAVAPPPRPVR